MATRTTSPGPDIGRTRSSARRWRPASMRRMGCCRGSGFASRPKTAVAMAQALIRPARPDGASAARWIRGWPLRADASEAPEARTRSGSARMVPGARPLIETFSGRGCAGSLFREGKYPSAPPSPPTAKSCPGAIGRAEAA